MRELLILSYGAAKRMVLRAPPPATLFLFAPAALVVLAAAPFRYDITLAEPDLVRIAAALVYGASSGLHLAAGMHYGDAFSFGYYHLLYALVPDERLRDPDLAAMAINSLGLVAGVLCACACSVYFARLFGRAAAVAGTTLFLLSPLMLPIALSGHPLIAAAACLFFAAALIADTPRAASWRWPAALILFVLGLSLRAEIALAFPFVAAASAGRLARRRELVVRALLLAAAFGVFLLLQHPYVRPNGGAAAKLAAFLADFASVSVVGHGAAVFLFSTGLATLFLAWRLRKAVAILPQQRWLLVLLAGPALLLWLPNALPARHFFFPALAACLFVALGLEGRYRFGLASALIAALAVAGANQGAAELVHRILAPHYPWSYATAGRRATQHLPTGAFPLDQAANRAHAAVEREEAMRLATQAPRRLVVLADSQQYLIAHLLAAHGELRWREYRWKGVLATELKSADREYVLLAKSAAWPRDVTAEALAEPAWHDSPFYVQPTTRSRHDRTDVPAARRFSLD